MFGCRLMNPRRFLWKMFRDGRRFDSHEHNFTHKSTVAVAMAKTNKYGTSIMHHYSPRGELFTNRHVFHIRSKTIARCKHSRRTFAASTTRLFKTKAGRRVVVDFTSKSTSERIHSNIATFHELSLNMSPVPRYPKTPHLPTWNRNS